MSGYVTVHTPTLQAQLHARLTTWLANDMRSLTELIDQAGTETFAHAPVFTAAQKLLQALETAVAAVEHHTPPHTPQDPTDTPSHP